MIAFDHAVTGAAVAFLIKRPKVAVPLAFLSHFCLDVIPHFGTFGEFTLHNAGLLSVIAFDVLLTLGAFAFAILKSGKHARVVVMCMLAAILPDIISIPYLLGIFPENLFFVFHSGIQWFERPIGMISEVAYAAIMGSYVYRLVVSRKALPGNPEPVPVPITSKP